LFIEQVHRSNLIYENSVNMPWWAGSTGVLTRIKALFLQTPESVIIDVARINWQGPNLGKQKRQRLNKIFFGNPFF